MTSSGGLFTWTSFSANPTQLSRWKSRVLQPFNFVRRVSTAIRDTDLKPRKRLSEACWQNCRGSEPAEDTTTNLEFLSPALLTILRQLKLSFAYSIYYVLADTVKMGKVVHEEHAVTKATLDNDREDDLTRQGEERS